MTSPTHSMSSQSETGPVHAMEPLDFYLARCTDRDFAADKIPFQPRPDDVIIVGPPKSGTTWLQQILHQIRTGGDDKFSNIYDVTTHLPLTKPPYEDQEEYAKLDAEQVAQPRIFKIHCLHEMLQNAGGRTRFIVPIRHPYDTEYSYMKFLWRFLGYDRDMTAAEYLEVNEISHIHDFADLISSWYRHRNDPNVFIIPYEDLKCDLAASIQKIAVFIIGEPLAKTTLSKVVHFSSFEYMSKNVDKFKTSLRIIPTQWQNDAELHKRMTYFVRKGGGQVGQGKNMLDESIKRQIDKRWSDVIEKEFGFKNYDELYKMCSIFNK